MTGDAIGQYSPLVARIILIPNRNPRVPTDPCRRYGTYDPMMVRDPSGTTS